MENDVELFMYLVDLGLKIQDQTSFYWNFLIVGQLAIVGWMIEKGDLLTLRHRIAIALVFCSFLTMNWWGLSSSNLQKDVILSSVQELTESKNVSELFPFQITDGIKGLPSSGWYPYKFWFIWVPSNTVVLLIILYPAMRRKPKKISDKDSLSV